MGRRQGSAKARGKERGITLADGGMARAVFGVWADAARGQRKALRDSGVRGETRRLDERASGQRGLTAPREVFEAAIELARHGIPQAEALGMAVQTLARTYELAYAHALQLKPSA